VLRGDPAIQLVAVDIRHHDVAQDEVEGRDATSASASSAVVATATSCLSIRTCSIAWQIRTSSGRAVDARARWCRRSRAGIADRDRRAVAGAT
jgi:hypothetical protein